VYVKARVVLQNNSEKMKFKWHCYEIHTLDGHVFCILNGNLNWIMFTLYFQFLENNRLICFYMNTLYSIKTRALKPFKLLYVFFKISSIKMIEVFWHYSFRSNLLDILYNLIYGKPITSVQSFRSFAHSFLLQE
jgi:hypothetical protein